MACSSPHNYNGHSEPAKIEQIITEFFAKSLHIILESRSPCVSSRHYSGEQMASPSSSSSSSSSVRPRDKWFNLALRECPAALENSDFWRQSNLEPMIVDVVLLQRPSFSPTSVGGGGELLMRNLSSKERWKEEKIIERWVVKYEIRKSSTTSSTSKRSGGNGSHSLYKKSIILFRSLYLTVRMLPAYKLFQDLNLSAHVSGTTFTLSHRVSSFVEPFTRREEAEMKQFGFTPIDTPCGRLCLSVLYRSSLSDHISSESSTPMSPQFIPDYVGSPTTDPLKRFPSLPMSHGSPSSVPFSRRHSWSYDLSRASAPSLSPSPSPTYSDSCAFSSKLGSYPPQSANSPRQPPENPDYSNANLSHDKYTGCDEYWPSPIFSLSPSPSPPTHLSGSPLSKALLRSESAPVSIPPIKLGKSPTIPNSHIPPLSPSRGSKATCLSHTETARAPTRVGDIQTGLITQRVSSTKKDEAGNLSGAKLSSLSSPRVSFSRSSGRLSFQDDFYDTEFACPFAVDDDDITDPRARSKSFDGEARQPGGLLPIRKSQDAAVGDLVRMLRTAPPLRHDFSNSIKLSQVRKNIEEPVECSKSEVVVENASSDLGITSSGLLVLKTTSEALEELRSYRDMKHLLLKQGTGSLALSNSNVSETVD